MAVITKKIKKRREPTLKQERTFNMLLENPRKSVSGAMRDAGYAHTSAIHPAELTKSEGWQTLMEKHLPDAELAKIHDELLHSNALTKLYFNELTPDEDIKNFVAGLTGARLQGIQVVDVPFKGKLKEAVILTPNFKARKEALEMAYKLQGKFAPEKFVDPEAQDKLEQIRNEIKNFIGAK